MCHSASLMIQSSKVANFLPRPLDKLALFTEEVKRAGTPLLKTLEGFTMPARIHPAQPDFGSQAHELHATTRHMRSQLV